MNTASPNSRSDVMTSVNHCCDPTHSGLRLDDSAKRQEKSTRSRITTIFNNFIAFITIYSGDYLLSNRQRLKQKM